MGFLERLEQKSRERSKKSQEDGERALRIEQENQDRLRLQKTVEREEKKRLLKLRREASVQFAASGLEAMLDRLKKVRAIKSNFSDSVVGEDVEQHLPEKVWDEMKIEDGSFHTKVVVLDERLEGIYGSYANTNKFFYIITDSTGLITFEYGTILPRHKEVQRSEWRKDPNLLEYLLGKAFNSPRTIREKGKRPMYTFHSER